jgi:3-isopropylmalate/(R)-2-methylmalate dehydratase small subunit
VTHAAIDVPALELHAFFPLEQHARDRIVLGLDDIAVTLTHQDAIARHEASRPEWLPRVTYRR